MKNNFHALYSNIVPKLYFRAEKGASSLSDNGLDSDTELSHSYDILPDMDFGKSKSSYFVQKVCTLNCIAKIL